QYADDLVGLAESNEDAKTMVQGIHTWTQRWGMALGVPKCGVILWSDSQEEHDRHQATEYNTPDGNIPIVSEYKYLGIKVTEGLGGEDDYEKTYVTSQAEKGQKALNAIRPILLDKTWPIPVKVAVIRTLLIP
ncbi:hypothetical protein FA15DRAFT_559059, partial [Coprinopsis marcescibilis]